MNIVYTVFAVIMFVVFTATLLAPFFGWKISAKHKEFIRFQSHHIPRAEIREAFKELRWALVRDEDSDMVARSGLNLLSWGELVSVHFRDGGADVKSECSFVWQAVDYGQNRMNVKKFAEALKRKNA